jgi:hypothetical protein
MSMTRAVPFLILVALALAAVFMPEAAPPSPAGRSTLATRPGHRPFRARRGLLSGQTHTMMFHLVALVLVTAFAFVMSYALYWVTDRLITLRVPVEQEAVGLDISQHSEYLDLEPFRQFGGRGSAEP